MKTESSKNQMKVVESIPTLLSKMKSEIARCLPKHITVERMTRIALTELRRNPKIQECDPLSFVAAIMQASQLGLEPGVLGSCYLIPYGRECTFMPGYRGFLDLARRSGMITSLVARSVYENDDFSFEFGLNEIIKHKPSLTERGKMIAVYAVAVFKDGGHQFDVMSIDEVNKIRDSSKSRNSGPWFTHFEEMAKKTVLRRLFKWLPCSVEMQKAVSLDELQEAGLQNIKAAAAEEFDIDFLHAENDKNNTNKLKEVLNIGDEHEKGNSTTTSSSNGIEFINSKFDDV